MVVEDYINILGRGWVLIAHGDELSHMPIHCGGKIVSNETIFTITGVERSKYDDNWYAKRVGFILSPNNIVPDCFKVGQIINIITEEE